MTTYTIPQTCLGQINIIGECCAFGLATFDDDLVYLDLAGSATSIEAVWAKLAQGKPITLVRPQPEAPLELTPEASGTFTRFQRPLGTLRVHHLVLVHKAITAPVYANLGLTYVFNVAPEQVRAKLCAHVTELVEIAVFPAWHTYLETQGRATHLIRPCLCAGGVQIEALTLDRAAWTQVISSGLAAGEISLPAD